MKLRDKVVAVLFGLPECPRADELGDAADAVIRIVMEEAARVAERFDGGSPDPSDVTASQIADEIRNSVPPEPALK